MKKSFLTFLTFLAFLNVFGQYNVRFIAQERSHSKHDTIYITGNFNNWNPGSFQYRLQSMGSEHKAILLKLPRGRYEYKFTRGDWMMIEKDIECQEIENRIVQVNNDTTINALIENWKDVCLSRDTSLESLQLSLKNQQNDSDRVVTLNRLSRKMCYRNDYESADDYANEALNLAIKIGFKRGEGSGYISKGLIALAQLNYAEARKNFFTTLKIDQELNRKLQSAYTIDLIGDLYLQEENYPEALNFYYANLRSYENLGDKTSIARMLHDIAAVYVLQNNNEEAIKKFREALNSFKESFELYQETWMKTSIAVCHNSIADIFLKEENFDEALANDSAACRIFEEVNNEYGLGMALTTKGNIYKKQGDISRINGNKIISEIKYREALKEYLHALRIFETFQDKEKIAGCNISIGKIYMNLENFNTARFYFKKGENLSKEIGSKLQLKECFNSMSELDILVGNFRQAYEHYKLYILYHDSLINEESTKKSLQIKMQYEFDKKQDSIKAVQDKKDALTIAEIKNQKLARNFSLAGATAVLFFSGYGFYWYKRKKRLQNQQALINDRLRISRELHDEVGATLSGIVMYSHLTKEQIKNANTTEVEKSLDIMQQSSGEMVNKLNDIVWLINPEQDSLQKLIQRLEEYAIDMATIKNMQVKINVPDQLHEYSLPMESRRNIYLFCKEAINNAVKYSNGTLLELNIKDVDHKLEFSVSDNGKGFNAVMVRRRNGLENMQKRADEIGAKLTVQSRQNEGTFVSMQVKIT